MKNLFLSLIISGAAIQASTVQLTPPPAPLTSEQKEKQTYKEATGKIAEHLSQLVTNFFQIAKNHHDSAQVGSNIAGILDNIIKIGLECMKRSNITASSSPEEIEALIMKIEEELHNLLQAIITKRTLELTQAY